MTLLGRLATWNDHGAWLKLGCPPEILKDVSDAAAEIERLTAALQKIADDKGDHKCERLRAVLRDVPVLFINRDAAKKNADVAALEYSEKLALWAPRAKALLSGAYDRYETPAQTARKPTASFAT